MIYFYLSGPTNDDYFYRLSVYKKDFLSWIVRLCMLDGRSQLPQPALLVLLEV